MFYIYVDFSPEVNQKNYSSHEYKSNIFSYEIYWIFSLNNS